MHKILQKRNLNSTPIIEMEVEAPWVARSGKPGQFVIIIVDEEGERVPLTICDIHHERNSVTLVFQVVGDSTRKLSEKQVGDTIHTLVGPLGRPSELLELSDEDCRKNRLLMVAGGVGTAPIYPQVKWAHEKGIAVDVIIGARSKELLFYEEEMRQVCDHLYLMTDDGSYGEQGLVTKKIEELVNAAPGSYSHCVAIGPLMMMKFVAKLTQQLGLKTIVSMNCMMVDGTGMCGACRVTVGGKVKFTCVDGPEFDGHEVDFDEAARRLAKPDTKKYPIARNQGGHHCNLADAVEDTTAAVAAEKKLRQKPREQDPALRAKNFDEVSFGFTEAQAVAEAQRCLHCKKPGCVGSCPVSIRIPDFIQAVAQRQFEEAYRIISESSALPAVCGRVCPQENQCEGRCILGVKGEPIAIGALERFVADHVGANLHPDNKGVSKAKVAIIGSGPSGLTCAHDLALKGFDVTIFEALHQPGGVLVYGIPEFRLPKQKVVQPEIDRLKALGVKIETNVIVGKSITIDNLQEQGFRAIYVATGAGLPKFMGIPGETLVGVVSANELLTRTNLMHGYDEHYDTPIHLGKKVVVVGGGNVAMDAARTALRLGSEVTVVYRRGQQDMPARKEEVHHAMEEGIHFAFTTNPVEILGDEKGCVNAVRCIRMQMGEPDAKGRRSFNAIAGSEFEMEADNVVIALGTSPNPLIKNTTPGLDTTPAGGIATDETGLTSRPMVFAGGDAVSGAATVILAMGAGRTAATSIAEMLEDK